MFLLIFIVLCLLFSISLSAKYSKLSKEEQLSIQQALSTLDGAVEITESLDSTTNLRGKRLLMIAPWK
jgi:hypothetical protein